MDPRVKSVTVLMKTGLRSQVKLPELARAVNVSPAQLCHLFRAERSSDCRRGSIGGNTMTALIGPVTNNKFWPTDNKKRHQQNLAIAQLPVLLTFVSYLSSQSDVCRLPRCEKGPIALSSNTTRELKG
jgi:hypothetical protein